MQLNVYNLKPYLRKIEKYIIFGTLYALYKEIKTLKVYMVSAIDMLPVLSTVVHPMNLKHKC